MKNFIYLLLLFSSSSACTFAQSLLTLEDAIAITLEKNFDIRLAKNDLQIDQENVSIGNAGMLPRVNGVITNSNTVLNIDQTFANGNEVEISGAKNLNLNFGVGLEWTIFDGFRMFARHNQLKELQKLGETELKFNVLTKVSEVYDNYFILVNQQHLIRSLDSIITVSEFRLKTAQTRFNIGKASKLEVLNAEVDYNADVAAKIRLNEQYAISKIALNLLLVQPSETNFIVSDSILIDESLKLIDLLTLAQEQNPELQMQYINKKIQEYELKQVKAARYPSLSLSTGYNLIRSETPFGFVTQSTGRNFNYGFTATMNIFDGFNQTRNERTSKIQLENTQLLIDRQKQTVHAQISSIYKSYLSNLALLEMEQKNEKIAQQNLEITLDKFKIGTISPVEFRTAQVNYANAVIRLTNAKLLAKQTEISLKEIAGNLTF